MRKLLSYTYSGGSIYVAGILGADAVNFLFNAVLGRYLNFSDFGLIALINALSYIGSIILGALSTTITHRISFLSGKGEDQKVTSFFYKTAAMVVRANGIYIILWLLFIIPLSTFFHINSDVPLLLFLPVLPCGFINAMNKGFLTGKLFLKSVGLLSLSEALIKFITAVFFVYFNAASFAYISVPFSIASVSIISFFMIRKMLPSQKMSKQAISFPGKFFIATLLISFSTSAFLALDVLAAKHYLSGELAGEYAFLALMGKIIYFSGSLLLALIVAFTSHSDGKGHKKSTATRHLLLISLALTGIPYIIIAWFGKWILPVFFGSKTYVILPFIPQYAFAIALFTISIQIVSYYLAKKKYIFSGVTIFTYLIMLLSIIFIHKTIWDIIHVILYTSILQFTLVIILHGLKGNFVRRIAYA